MNSDLGDLGPDFDIDLLGIKDFVLEPAEFEMPDLSSDEVRLIQQMTFTVSNEQVEEIKNALEKAKKMGDFYDTGNENSNGNALARICGIFLTT